MGERLTRALRWFVIGAPVLAGVLLLILGTAGATSAAFGMTLIGITPIVWMWNWFLRMSFADTAREREQDEREQRAREQRQRLTPSPSPPAAAPKPRHPPSRLGRRPRRPQ